jgi:hypothetical protein
MKKMAKGGSMKTTVGKATPKGLIYGMPQTGPTGPNYQGVNTMKKGGMVKKQDGGAMGSGRAVEKKTFSTSNNMYDLAGKKKIVSRDGETVKTRTKTTVTPNKPGSITSTGKPITKVSVSKGDGPAKTRRAIIPVKAQKGGATSFGMLSVKAGVDKNPKPTAADRIAGAKMKKGGSTDKKWIQKAINPAHKGYCTPMTKPTCTPKRKALAMTLKKIAKKR